MSQRSRFGKIAFGATALIAGVSLIAAACGGGTSSADKTATAAKGGGSTPAATKAAATSAATTAATTPAAAATTAATAASGASGKAAVNVGDTAIGKVLVDDKGFTLYTFKNDVVNSGKSAVPAALLPNWPPLVTTAAATKGAGVTGDLGTATLDDGTKVVSYKGLPLYHFINDKAPGDTKGDKVASIWFVAVP
jgi:predicted lipoprotein with Yx(FWY)xxD motif